MAAMPSTPRTARPAPAVTGTELVGLGPELVVGLTVTVPKLDPAGGVMVGMAEGSSVTGQTVVVTMTSTVVRVVLRPGHSVTVSGHWVMVRVVEVVMVEVVHLVGSAEVDSSGSSVSVSQSDDSGSSVEVAGGSVTVVPGVTVAVGVTVMVGVSVEVGSGVGVAVAVAV